MDTKIEHARRSRLRNLKQLRNSLACFLGICRLSRRFDDLMTTLSGDQVRIDDFESPV